MDYLSDRNRCSLRSADIGDRAGYNRSMRFLEGRTFWNGGRRVRSLWLHQKQAIALIAGYINSDKRLDDGTLEAALVKMPTGSGKSGVIAVSTRCFPSVKKVLVLTPRTALADQLQRDISSRFWKNIGLEGATSDVWAGDNVEPADVDRLLPGTRTLAKIMGGNSERHILVGTLQALDQIRTSRDRINHKIRRGKDISDSDAAALAKATEFLSWLQKFDLIVVDEGHYEPAPSWSRSVRELNCPTLLLSATPFRNDYKLFRVKGRFLFNFPFQDALEQRIVRDIEIYPAASSVVASRQPSTSSASEQDTTGATQVSAEDRAAVGTFVSGLARMLPPILSQKGRETAKVIVRGGSFEILELLQAELQTAFSQMPLLIHERISQSPNEELKGRFHSVTRAQKISPNSRFWLHQTKLLEGIDDATFAVVAIFDSFSNARQLVQQIGRVIRSTDLKRRQKQAAIVLVPQDSFAETENDWKRYLEFERYASTSLETVVPSESLLPETIIRHMPEMQYVDGHFRHRLPTTTLDARDLRLPKRAAVFESKDAFNLYTAAKEIEESLLAKNRFVVRPVRQLPQDTLAWTYFTVDETPLLGSHFISEWRFGVSLVTQIGSHVFVFDSDGIAFEPHRVDLGRPSESTFTRLLPENSVITQISARSLDMSDRAIRSLTQRTRSFADTFTDLLDPVLRPTAISGFVNGTGRYLGVVRRKVADALQGNVPIDEYIQWLEDVNKQLTDPSATSNSVFQRYATRVQAPADDKAEPVNILLDLSDVTEMYHSDDSRLPQPETGLLSYDDFCVDVTAGAFEIRGNDGESVPCSIAFNPKTERYRISSQRLNERHPPKLAGGNRRPITLTEKINATQSFRLLTKDARTVYMYGDFLQTRDVLSGNTVLPLECAVAIAELRDTVSEKGEPFLSTQRWRTESIFGLVKDYCSSPGAGGGNELERLLRSYDLVLLDDGPTELGDFVAIGNGKCAIIHAKASNDVTSSSVSALEAVGRQAISSLAFCSTAAQVSGIGDGRWDRPTVFNRVPVQMSRVFRNERNIPNNQISAKVRETLLNPTTEREIWIVAGRLFDVEKARRNALSSALSNHQRQLLMFLTSLSTACGRGNARLRVFGHPSAQAPSTPRGSKANKAAAKKIAGRKVTTKYATGKKAATKKATKKAAAKKATKKAAAKKVATK